MLCIVHVVSYRLNNVVLETVEYEKDLGLTQLTVSSALNNWDEHIKNSLSNSRQIRQ